MPNPPAQDVLGDLKAKKEMMNYANQALGNNPPAETPKATPAAMNVDKINKSGKPFGSVGKEKILPNIDQMTKPLGQLHKGTPFVPKTGNYTLKKGEAVVPAEDNKMDTFAGVPGRSAEKPKKVIHEIRSRKAKDGTVIHEHHHTHPEHHKMEEHTSPDAAAAGDHVASMLGEDAGAPPAPDAGAPPAGAPAAGAPPAASAAPAV